MGKLFLKTKKNKMTKDETITEKLKIVCAYGRQIQGKVFGINKEGGKNKMAMALFFQMEYQSFRRLVNRCQNPLTEEECDKAIEKLDSIINNHDSPDYVWDEFWDGKQPINPAKMVFAGLDGRNAEFVNLNNVENITIPMLGIKGD